MLHACYLLLNEIHEDSLSPADRYTLLLSGAAQIFKSKTACSARCTEMDAAELLHLSHHFKRESNKLQLSPVYPTPRPTVPTGALTPLLCPSEPAAYCIDVNHPGVNNMFLSKTKDPLVRADGGFDALPRTRSSAAGPVATGNCTAAGWTACFAAATASERRILAYLPSPPRSISAEATSQCALLKRGPAPKPAAGASLRRRQYVGAEPRSCRPASHSGTPAVISAHVLRRCPQTRPLSLAPATLETET